MKTIRLNTPLLASLAAVLGLSACATSRPVAYRITDDTETRIVRPVRVDIGPARAGRYRTIEPVAERIYFYETTRRRPFTNFQYTQTGWTEEMTNSEGFQTPIDPDGVPR